MFYDEFIKLCNMVHMSPTSVAKAVGLAGAHVTKWKKGSTPTDATVYKLCDYFGVSYDYFDKKNTPTGSGERTVDLSEVDYAFYGDYKELSEAEQETLRDMVRIMRERRSSRQEK